MRKYAFILVCCVCCSDDGVKFGNMKAHRLVILIKNIWKEIPDKQKSDITEMVRDEIANDASSKMAVAAQDKISEELLFKEWCLSKSGKEVYSKLRDKIVTQGSEEESRTCLGHIRDLLWVSLTGQ